MTYLKCSKIQDTTEQPDDSIRMVLLCGLPGSGKSTLARSFAKSTLADIVFKERWQFASSIWLVLWRNVFVEMKHSTVWSFPTLFDVAGHMIHFGEFRRLASRCLFPRNFQWEIWIMDSRKILCLDCTCVTNEIRCPSVVRGFETLQNV